MIVFEIGVVIDGFFEVLWIVVDENGILLDFVAVDFKEVDFGVFLDDLVEFLTADLSLRLLFHWDLIDISTYKFMIWGHY